MSKNSIPQTYSGIVPLAVKALAGSISLGATIDLQHHTNVEIAADLYDLIGNPATPAIPGKQATLNTRKQALKDAYTTARAASAAGREYCRLGISLLKTVLGTTHSSAWTNAGFLAPNLQIKKSPVAMLIQFRQYFEANAARENAAAGVTAVQAQARLTAIQNADLAVAAAKAAKLGATRIRDLALRSLQKRMSGLRAELEQLLDSLDGQWLEFGFRLPGGGQIPAEVEGLILTAGLPGTVLVEWQAASLADNYRVTWRPSSAEPGTETDAGLFSDLQTLLVGLPSAVPIIVGVSARNSTGETSATSATITVP